MVPLFTVSHMVVYSGFALVEYCMVVANIVFHTTNGWDFQEFDLAFIPRTAAPLVSVKSL